MDDIRFGEYITEKRKTARITLRKMAEMIGISPAYLSDIEKSRRNPPDVGILGKISSILNLTEEERDKMFDLAGKDRNEVSPDLPEYIMKKPVVRAALRKASKQGATDDDWKKFIEKLDKE
ncbi:XRE family transcriptional regulator [Acidilutibacter cellobiosedens]|uniref:XRE family transcriptional regulator n=1 Tax=Acidilutibacter cellobiosedens TaxID=2507161 RepID=A0A410QDC7_9FIRM|nr:helix-turn-helix transcriptional regulator [Acidilutibacter cellobiosedens]QAT61995.1 XRE family transcriptional regulator [Acidilutibacter cellobiosedens]HBN04357.1 transcriptional regulator [Bacteroidales bacterium]